MTGRDWLALLSGSDIRGFGLGDPENPLYLSDTVVKRSTEAFLDWLAERTSIPAGELRVSVGHDPRLSAPRMKEVVLTVLRGRGVQAFDCGLCTTPAMFMTTLDLNCDGAIQLTASHHPAEYNGLKFFTKDGGLTGTEVKTLLEMAASGADVTYKGETLSAVTYVFYMEQYAARLRNMICEGLGKRREEQPLRGVKIAVVAGNGAGGFFASDVLAPLGADVSSSLYLEPDGSFPHFVPNPEKPQMLQAGCTAVKDTGADLGILFDTDVDRVGCIGRGGVPLNRNRLIALCAAIVLEDCPGGTIVTDSVTSDGLTRFISDLGGRHLRYKRGYQHVIGKQKELEATGIPAPLGMETSGHAAFRDNYFLDDGACLATRLIIQMAKLAERGQTLEGLIVDLPEALETAELRLKIRHPEFGVQGERFIVAIQAHAAKTEGWRPADMNYDGIRINADAARGDGWFLARLSVHDPIVVLNLESMAAGGVKKMAEEILNAVRGVESIDRTALEEFVRA